MNRAKMKNIKILFFGGQFKEKCRNCGMIGHNSTDRKNKFRQNGGQNGGNQVNSNNGAYCTYCR